MGLTVFDAVGAEPDEPAGAGELGRVAIDVAASPLMTFHGYYQADPEQSAAKVNADGRWYLTGDAGRMDADGDFFFSSRDDDAIIMAGYRIGPFEIESVLAQHTAVTECSVIAAPDPIRGEVIEAYVVLRPSSGARAWRSRGCLGCLQRAGLLRWRARVVEAAGAGSVDDQGVSVPGCWRSVVSSIPVTGTRLPRLPVDRYMIRCTRAFGYADSGRSWTLSTSPGLPFGSGDGGT